jgi:hypothetical protein
MSCHIIIPMVIAVSPNGDCRVPRDFATVEGSMLGNWVHDQRNKFKKGQFIDDRINLLSDLQFDFSMQTNFTLPNLKLLNELGIIKLPSNFKLKETTTANYVNKKEMKKKMTKVPPKAKAQDTRATVSRVSVVAPKKKITAPRPKANTPIQPKMKLKMAPKKISSAPRAKAKASIEPKKILQNPLTSNQVPSQPTRTYPRRVATAIDVSYQQGTSFHSVHNNPFSKLKSMPAQMYPLSSSLLPEGGGSNVE